MLLTLGVYILCTNDVGCFKHFTSGHVRLKRDHLKTLHYPCNLILYNVRIEIIENDIGPGVKQELAFKDFSILAMMAILFIVAERF